MLIGFEQGGFAPLVARFGRRDLLVGREVSCTQAGLDGGVAEGVDADGALRLRVGDRLHRVASGEVSVRLASSVQTC